VRRSIRASAVVLGLVALVVPATSAAAQKSPIELSVLSSRPDQVSGGDALVRVDAPRGLLRKLRVERNGENVTRAFQRQGDGLVGLVDGLRLGKNTITVYRKSRWWRPPAARRRITNHPITGPIFSGPHQTPFVCKTIQMGLGEPLVDSQDGTGFTVLDSEGNVAGYSQNCGARTQVDYMYMSTETEGFKPLPAGGGRPADLAKTKTRDGRIVDFVVRRQRGTINRFVYSYAMLAPLGSGERNTSLWNRRLIYAFDGGVAIGHQQGALGGIGLTQEWLGLGYAVAYSSGTRTNTHYNLQLGGETALMTKERFVEQYGVPLYTVGIGGSGGGIQQYVYGQNHQGLIDAAVPQKSYSDMVTQGIHIGDCELLEHYMDVTDAANPKWRDWENREWLEGLNASATIPNEYTGQPGSSECVEGWRGLTPLTLNPLFGSAGAGSERMAPEGVMSTVEWTHADDLRNIYGEEPDGYARSTWDNVGVQYGLKALVDGRITPAEFLDLNAKVGTWKESRDMVQEGEPFVDGGGWDPWSSRNMRLSPDGGATPAPRRTGSIEAMNAAYESGLVFDGDIDIPVIDERAYLEDQLDMHNTYQSFATRQRMLDRDGDASNQVIWFAWPTPGETGTPMPMTLHAFRTIDEWMANIRRHPKRSVAENKPPAAVDSCFQHDAEPIARGRRVWDGILDDRAEGACAREFPIYSNSRMVAGGPIRGGIFKCQTQPVSAAIRAGVYGSWRPTNVEKERLKQIFPTGVCDYSLPDAGRP
jgi:Tannase-like family of unknown function (DUF6351)